MNCFVVDANVAIKWYVPEILSAQADHFLEDAATTDAKLFGPDLIIAELGNTLWKKHRMKELSLKEAREILVKIQDSFPVRVYAASSLLESAWEIARTYDRSVYDALYIALAEQQKAVLITADQKLVNALNQSPLKQYIQWLGGS